MRGSAIGGAGTAGVGTRVFAGPTGSAIQKSLPPARAPRPSRSPRPSAPPGSGRSRGQDRSPAQLALAAVEPRERLKQTAAAPRGRQSGPGSRTVRRSSVRPASGRISASHPDFGAGVSELHGVAQQIDQHLPEPAGIVIQLSPARRAQARAAGSIRRRRPGRRTSSSALSISGRSANRLGRSSSWPGLHLATFPGCR